MEQYSSTVSEMKWVLIDKVNSRLLKERFGADIEDLGAKVTMDMLPPVVDHELLAKTDYKVSVQFNFVKNNFCKIIIIFMMPE